MTDSQRKAMQMALEALNVGIMKMNALGCAIECMPLHYANKALRKTLAEPVVEPVAWLYTLEYGATVVNTTVSLHQLNYPFGVCGADYAQANDDGFSYVRQTPLYASPPAKVPMLTAAEILAIMRDGNNCNYNDEGEHIDFAREIEQIIRKKAGIK